MNQPKNYAETQAAGDYTPINLGGHYLVIKAVEEMQSKNGLPMIKISFDMADNDSQPHYFSNAYLNDIRPDKKWPAAGVVYMTTEDTEGRCTRNFKGFTTSVEKSNPGFQTGWGDGFAASYKNKLIGGIFREELDVYNGKETHRRKLAWFCANEKVSDADVPAVFETKEHKSWKESGGITTAAPDVNGFMNIPDGIDTDELPFA